MGKTMPYLAGLAAIAVSAFGLGVYVMTGGGTDARFIIGLLAFGVFAASLIILGAIYRLEKEALADRGDVVDMVRNDLVNFDKRLHMEASRVEDLAGQMHEVQSAAQQSHEAMTQGLQELRQGYTDMSGQLREAVAAISSSLAQPNFAHQSAAHAASAYGYTDLSAYPDYVPANDGPYPMPEGLNEGLHEGAHTAATHQAAEAPAGFRPTLDDDFETPHQTANYHAAHHPEPAGHADHRATEPAYSPQQSHGSEAHPANYASQSYAPMNDPGTRILPTVQVSAAQTAANPALPLQPASRTVLLQAAKPRAPRTDELLISLEPVIDVFTNKTVHYRLHLGMTKPNGTEVPTDMLLHHADRAGLRTQFDLHAAKEALGLLRHLRGRDPELNIFMPLGASTLQSDETIEKLLDLRKQFTDVAAGLVIELPHATLAGLSERGLEGLARLARNGVYLALTNVAIAGVDLRALAKLNVRYISLTSTTALGTNGPSPIIQSFAQTARIQRIQLIVTAISDAALAKQVSKIGRFVAGPAFAPPRRVKAGMASEPVRSASFAA
jgi:EAL domain-containing protein (putative c-di-GMP-specific phosphodiesterase class I)